MWDLNSIMGERYIEDHRQKMIQQAEHDRLVAEAHRGRRRPARLHAALLVRLGTWLQAVGVKLESRFGEPCCEGYDVATSLQGPC